MMRLKHPTFREWLICLSVIIFVYALLRAI